MHALEKNRCRFVDGRDSKCTNWMWCRRLKCGFCSLEPFHLDSRSKMRTYHTGAAPNRRRNSSFSAAKPWAKRPSRSFPSSISCVAWIPRRGSPRSAHKADFVVDWFEEEDELDRLRFLPIAFAFAATQEEGGSESEDAFAFWSSKANSGTFCFTMPWLPRFSAAMFALRRASASCAQPPFRPDKPQLLLNCHHNRIQCLTGHGHSRRARCAGFKIQDFQDSFQGLLKDPLPFTSKPSRNRIYRNPLPVCSSDTLSRQPMNLWELTRMILEPQSCPAPHGIAAKTYSLRFLRTSASSHHQAWWVAASGSWRETVRLRTSNFWMCWIYTPWNEHGHLNLESRIQDLDSRLPKRVQGPSSTGHTGSKAQLIKECGAAIFIDDQQDTRFGVKIAQKSLESWIQDSRLSKRVLEILNLDSKLPQLLAKLIIYCKLQWISTSKNSKKKGPKICKKNCKYQ